MLALISKLTANVLKHTRIRVDDGYLRLDLLWLIISRVKYYKLDHLPVFAQCSLNEFAWLTLDCLVKVGYDR